MGVVVTLKNQTFLENKGTATVNIYQNGAISWVFNINPKSALHTSHSRFIRNGVKPGAACT